MNFLIVFLGGGIGAILRYCCNLACPKNLFCNFPLATFLANVLGCLFLGIILGILQAKINMPPQLKLFLIVGIAGGFTTFSSFSFEIFDFLEKNNTYLAIFYPILSLTLGILAITLGIYLSKAVLC